MNEPLVLGIETSCDETGVGIVRGHTCWPTRSRAASTSTPASAVSCPRSPAAPTSRRWCRPSSAPARPPASALRPRRDRGDQRPRSGRRTAGRGGGGEGARARSRQADLRRQPPRRPRRGRPARARAAARAVPGDAGQRRPLQPAAGRRRDRRGRSRSAPTIDDAAGEAFDKVARLLGLPFPGGPHIDRVARVGQLDRHRLPARAQRSRRDLERHRFDFSFSGLKTAVARWVEARERSGEPVPVNDVAASFQEAVCDVLVRKALDAARHHGHRGHPDRRRGGRQLAAAGDGRGARRRPWASGCGCPRPGLCTDNGAMVAALGSEMVARGRTALAARPAGRLVAAGHQRPGLTLRSDGQTIRPVRAVPGSGTARPSRRRRPPGRPRARSMPSKPSRSIRQPASVVGGGQRVGAVLPDRAMR